MLFIHVIYMETDNSLRMFHCHIFNALLLSAILRVCLLHFQMRLNMLKEMLSLHLGTSLFSLTHSLMELSPS
jgi:hypothetical protein